MEQVIFEYKDPNTNITKTYLTISIDNDYGSTIYRVPIEDVTQNQDFTSKFYQELHKDN